MVSSLTPDAQGRVIFAADPWVATTIPKRSARILFGLLALTTTMSSKTLRSDPDEIERAINVFQDKGSLVEGRIPSRKGTRAGWYTDRAKLARDLAANNGELSAYFTLNPCKPALLARSANRLGQPRSTTSDKDIERLRWVPGDFDPIRPADISASDEEHRAALAKAREVSEDLTEQHGWARAVLGDPGNGGHALWRIDLPNDEISVELVKRVLQALAAHYDDNVVKIDQSVYNPGRIWKAYGTVSRKGDDIPERPHRRSQLLYVPETIELVTREQLEEFAARFAPKEQAQQAPRDQRYERFDFENFIHWKVKARPPVPHEGGLKWVLEQCPFDESHKAPDSAVFRHADGSLGFKCFHNSCANYTWKDVRAKFDPPRPRAERPNWQPRDEDVPPEFRSQRDQASEEASAEEASAEEWSDPIPLRPWVLPTIQAEWIPGALGEMCVAVAKATETPLEVAVLMGSGVVSCCIAGKVEVEVEAGYIEPVNLYNVPVMGSGNRRTAVVNEMTRPLTEHESREWRRLQPEINRAKSKRKTIEARINWLRQKAAKAPGNTTLVNQIADEEDDLPDIPHAPRLWTQDVTPEKLAVLLEQNRERMGVFSDEGDLFEILRGRYTGDPHFDIYLKGHSGSPARVDRISRPDPIFLEHPLLSIAISPQPAVLEVLRGTPAFRGKGLLARIFYALPASTLGYRKLDPQPVPDDVREAYRRLIADLIQLMPPSIDDVWQPWRLRLSPEAYRIWKQFQRDVEEMMRDGGTLECLQDWGSKLPGGVARLAGVFHAVVLNIRQNDVEISRDTVERAIKLGTALIPHARAAFDMMERDPKVDHALKILEWVRRKRLKTFTARDCFCDHRSRFNEMAVLRPVLAFLVECDYLRALPKTTTTKKKGRPPSELYAVNPSVLEESI
jgi:hypothetical protein